MATYALQQRERWNRRRKKRDEERAQQPQTETYTEPREPRRASVRDRAAADETSEATPLLPKDSAKPEKAAQYRQQGRLHGNGLLKEEAHPTETTMRPRTGLADALARPSERTAGDTLAKNTAKTVDGEGDDSPNEPIVRFDAAREQRVQQLRNRLVMRRIADALAQHETGEAPKSKVREKHSRTAPNDAVAERGSSADYALVTRAGKKLDFTDWNRKTTTQQRQMLKRSGLSDEEQWTLLNKDGNYVETLHTIADLREHSGDYGLSRTETEAIGRQLLTLAAARANATGNDRPYLGKLPRAQMVKLLDEKKRELLQFATKPKASAVGARDGVWYDEDTDEPMAKPLPTPPQTTPNPKDESGSMQTPLPQVGTTPSLKADSLPTENKKGRLFDRLLKVVERNRQLDWQIITGLNPARIAPVTQGLVRNAAKKNENLAVLLDTMESVLPEEKRLMWKKLHNPIRNAHDLAVIKMGRDAWEEFARGGQNLSGREDPKKQTWDKSMITDQGVYPSVRGSMGPFGSLQANGCGPMSLHNVNRILGEDSDFSDVAYEVTRDSNDRTILGGLLGMNPWTVRAYYEKKGYRVTPYLGSESVEKDHDAYLAMYLYGSEQGIGRFVPTGGHYVAAEYDKENDMFITYNDDYRDYPIRMKSLSHLHRTDKDKNPNTDDVDEKDEKVFTYIWGIDKRGGKR